MDSGKNHQTSAHRLQRVKIPEGDQSISARDKILREVVSNILAHRDYSNAYSAKFVIEQDVMYTENSNLPHGHGELQLNKFEAFPKNPPISKVFREIGYADELGSGMRNTNKYTKLYSGGTPSFIEDDVFRISIPIDNVANLKVGPGADRLKPVISKLAEVEEISVQEVMELTGKSRTTAWRYMQILVECGVVELTGNTNNAIYKRV